MKRLMQWLSEVRWRRFLRSLDPYMVDARCKHCGQYPHTDGDGSMILHCGCDSR
jgi:hypothetical protein